MKRNGRQHGMVRSYEVLTARCNHREGSWIVNEFDEPPTAGLFTKVRSKPTNHSKFTGKCGKARCVGCRLGPVQKSKNKTKGSHKLKCSTDVVSGHRLISCRVVDGGHCLNFANLSATELLDDLSYYCDDDDESYYFDDSWSDTYGSSPGGHYYYPIFFDVDSVLSCAFAADDESYHSENNWWSDDDYFHGNGYGSSPSEDDYVTNSFDVDSVLANTEEDEDWCLV